VPLLLGEAEQLFQLFQAGDAMAELPLPILPINIGCGGEKLVTEGKGIGTVCQGMGRCPGNYPGRWRLFGLVQVKTAFTRRLFGFGDGQGFGFHALSPEMM
jgi:hypothetical protein